jgi:2,3-bisphosphoglycerate-dependent phosphoglycerate mutase
VSATQPPLNGDERTKNVRDAHLLTRVVLVRHGESNTTVARIVGGPRTCSGLSPLGRQQAQALCDRWQSYREVPADVLIASHYPRARETASLVAPSLGELVPIIDAGWGEHDPGPLCDGLTYRSYAERYPDVQAAWLSHDPTAETFPGGETVAVFHERVVDALGRLLADHAGKTVVVACHGGVVDAVLRHTLGLASMGGFEIHTLNTSITELLHVEPQTWRLVRYNDAAHLAGLPAHTDPPRADQGS